MAPVNTPANSGPAPSPSVVNQISPSTLALAISKAGEAIYLPISDPLKAGAGASDDQKDPAIQRPATEKEKIPPPEPVSKLLLDFLHEVWRASGSAVEATLANIDRPPPNLSARPDAVPGDLAKANITYVPRKVTRTERL